MVSGEAELTIEGVTHALPARTTALMPPAMPFGVRFHSPMQLL